MAWRNGDNCTAVAILPILGVGEMQLYKAETPGPIRLKINPRIKETAKALWVITWHLLVAQYHIFAGMLYLMLLVTVFHNRYRWIFLLVNGPTTA